MTEKRLWEGNTRPLFELTSGSKGHIPITTTHIDADQLDSFGRIRVSNPVTLFDSKEVHEDNTILWYTKVTNVSGNAGSTWNPDTAAIVLTVDGSDNVKRQSKEYIPYQPGKSQLLLQTFIGTTPKAGISQKYGIFDDDNGLFFETSGLELRFVQRTKVTGAVVEQVVAQADWNIDKLDGTGLDAITLDPAKAQLLAIDYEWLGTGITRFGFFVDGKLHLAHDFNNTNSLSAVFMSTPDLPVRYEISATSDISTPVSLSCICAMVASEGGVEDEKSLIFSAGNESSLIQVGADNKAVLSIRPRSLYRGRTNRVLTELHDSVVFSEDGPLSYRVVYGGSVSNASWVHVNSDYSAMEFDVSGSLVTGGIVVAHGFIGETKNTGGVDLKDLKSKLPVALDIDGNHPGSPLSDVYSIVGIKIGATNTDISAHLAWKERR